MYGVEACVLTTRMLNELELRQKRIAAFVTGLPIDGGNSALWLESGLMPMGARYHIMSHRYFNRLMSLDLGLLTKALLEHQGGVWSSSYKGLIQNIVKSYELHYLTSKSSLAKISELTWESLLEDKYRMKSLRYLSLRAEKWELPGHIKDSKESKTLTKFRVGNAGLGNRAPIPGHGGNLKNCPLCMSVGIVAPLNEQHLVLTCGQMSREQELGGINKYREKFRGKDVGTILWNFLGGDKCDDRSLSELRFGSFSHHFKIL